MEGAVGYSSGGIGGFFIDACPAPTMMWAGVVYLIEGSRGRVGGWVGPVGARGIVFSVIHLDGPMAVAFAITTNQVRVSSVSIEVFDHDDAGFEAITV